MVKRISIAVVVIGLVFAAIKYYSNKNVKAAEEAAPVFKTSAVEIVEQGNKVEGFLKPYLGKVISMDGVLCEYYSVSDGECFLKLTAGIQKDTCFVVARPLTVSTLTSKEDWNPCDSAMVRTHNLYNLQEHPQKLFINIELTFINDADIDKFTFNKNCNTYDRYYKENTHHLENFCMNKVAFKGLLSSVKVSGDSTFLSFNNGVILGQEKLNKTAHYRKRL